MGPDILTARLSKQMVVEGGRYFCWCLLLLEQYTCTRPMPAQCWLSSQCSFVRSFEQQLIWAAPFGLVNSPFPLLFHLVYGFRSLIVF